MCTRPAIATGGLRVRKQQDTPLDFIPPGGMGAGCMRPPPLRRGCHNTTLSAPVLGMPAPRHVSPGHTGEQGIVKQRKGQRDVRVAKSEKDSTLKQGVHYIITGVIMRLRTR